MRIATWNINSVRLRLPLIKRLMQEAAPDILCLQETKAEDHVFPTQALQELGFAHCYFSGQKSYNGVAILSRMPLSNIHTEAFDWPGEKRHISATLPDGAELHNFYVPAGGDIPDPALNDKYDFKLKYMDAMIRWAEAKKRGKKSLIMVGDINIAPREHDVWSHKQLLDVVSHTPPETTRMERLRETFGWVDSVRHFVPETEKIYSWWSYRNRDWEKSDRGRRLDHIWLTPDLKDRLQATRILKPVRNWTQPSDHVPVVVEVA